VAFALAALFFILMGGMASLAGAFSVDVDNLTYSDDSGRWVEYDFSSGTVGTAVANAILLDGLTLASEGTSPVVIRPTGETGTNYLWGQAPGVPLPAVNVSLNPTTGRATLTMPTGAMEGVALLYAGGMPAPSPTTGAGWFYSPTLTNFQLDLDAQKAYSFSIGLARDESSGLFNHAMVDIVWVQGFFEGTMYNAPTLIIQARVENGENDLWESTPIVRTGLDPATTTLMFDLSVSNGNNFFAAVKINNEDMTNLGEYTLTTEQGSFVRFPDLYPYIYMEEESASTAPQAQVYSLHFQSDGKYYAGMHVNDPLSLASAVSVASSYCNFNLNWDDTSKMWYAPTGCLIGTNYVTSPYPSFTFNFTPKTGGAPIASVTKTITGYVTEFATNLQPTGSISTNPVFSWTGSSNASGYGVELSDSSGNRVWNAYGIPPSQTSIPYAGPALQNGTTYSYSISMNIEQGGVWNSSLSAPASFTYNGTSPTTISFAGAVKTAPDWPATTNMAPVSGTSVGAYAPGTTTPINTATPDGSGAFSLTGIPALSNFFLRVGPPTGYQVVLSKIMNWNSNIQALLPFALLTNAQYSALNTSGNGMILGRVALKSSPTTFLSGATVTATQLINGMPTNMTYPVTYTSGSTTQADGIYMVKNVPAGALVQLAVTLAGYTFDFNTSIVPTAADHVSEDSFFATPTTSGGTVSFNGFVKDTSDNPIGGVIVGSGTVTTTTATDGGFTLSGLPDNTPFTLKLEKTGYVSTYSSVMQAAAGTVISASRPFNLFTLVELNFWSGSTGRGVIRGRVVNSANPQAGYISGAVVSASGPHSYRVRYEDVSGNIVDSLTSTTAKGRFYILDVVEGDTVTVSVTQPNYTFPPETTFVTHDGAMSVGLVSGTAVSGRVAIGGYALNTTPAGTKNVTIAQLGVTDPVNETVSNPDGSWYLSVPTATNFQLKLSKPQDPSLAPSYTGRMQFGSGYTDLGGYTLFPVTKLGTGTGNWNVAAEKGIIVARVVDQSLAPIVGASVTAASANHPAIPYAICYDDACSGLTATSDSGLYIVRDVDEGDTVTVTARKDGYIFNSRIFPTHTGGVHQGRITGASGTLSATGQTFVSAGMGSVNVFAPVGLAWQTISNASWIHIISGASGTGNGTVSYTVDANAGAARTGTMTIGGQTFTVTQTGIGSGFPIATTTGSELGLSAAFDGTNYLVGIQGDAVSHNNITAQLVSPSGALVGSRISADRTGGLPLIAFDGTNYLMIWFDDAISGGELYGAFINKSGVVNTPFAIDAGPLSVKRDIGGIAFGGGTYLAAYYKTDATVVKDIVYGRLISPAGAIGSEFRISSGYGSQAMQNVAFDGTNFFVVWNDHLTNNAVKGRFVSPSGTLGTEITVKASGLPNDNPLTVAFAGGNYLVAWTDQVSTVPNNWDVFGQIVTPTGALSGGRISISTAPGQQFGPGIAFDGTNYLVSWTDLRNDADGDWVCDASEGTCADVRGQLVSASGALVGSELIINSDPGNQMGGVGGLPVNGKLFGLINTGFSLEMTDAGSGGVAGGDVYGMFLPVTPTLVNGVCGTANGQEFTAAPTANFCSFGNPTTVTGTGPWTWSCEGLDGGATVNCSANISYQPWKDDFTEPALDSSWQVVSGTGTYSLTDNVGYLRYNLTGQAYSGRSVGVSSSWSPSLALVRPFNGDNWVLKAKADYNIKWYMTGAQYQVFTVAFGAGNSAYLSITRGTDQWYNANILTAQLSVNGQAVAANNTMLAANDVVVDNWLKHTYFYEIRRNGRCLTLRYSADGTNYTTALSYQLPPAIEAVQRVIIDANVYSTAGSYVDWDYLDFAPTPVPNYGDINNDTLVDLADAVLALRTITRLDTVIRNDYETCGVDVDCNASIGTAEALYILQRAAGLR
jgi:hypothetical protein